MERGRRIFYDAADGKILYDSGEATGNLIPNASISSEDAIRYIDLPYGESSDLFAKAVRYHVNPATKKVVFDEIIQGEGSAI